MKTKTRTHSPALAVAAAASARAATAADPASVSELTAKIKSPDDAVRGPAWQGAAPCGAPAVKPLAEVMSEPAFEVARSARRALWKIARHAGRPGAGKERKAVVMELIPLLSKDRPWCRR